MAKLSIKQQKFCDEYLVNGFNANKAAEAAGYKKTTASQGARLLLRSPVKEYMATRVQGASEQLNIKHIDILKELLNIATCDISKAFDAEGQLKSIHDIPEDVRRAIAGIETDDIFRGTGDARQCVGYRKKIKFWDKNKALELLGKHLGIFELDNKQKGESLAAFLKTLGDE